MPGDNISLPPLSNRYFAMRHGQSLANVQSIIVSDPEVGTREYGLSATGIAQVEASLDGVPPAVNADIKIVSSDFLRARETAAIVATKLAVVEPVRYSENLRERFFGELDGGPDSCYEEVWARDMLDAKQSVNGVETTVSVLQRTTALVRELEARHRGAVIMLVAHGDVLQILQTAFENLVPAQHRQLNPLRVAEIRALVTEDFS
jgi:broad specificity phosphatase PhoE